MSFRQFKSLSAITMSLVATTTFAHAEENSASSQASVPSSAAPSNTSTVTEKVENKENPLDRLYADVFSTFHGPVVNNLSSPFGVNNKGQVTSKNSVYFDSELTTAYLVDKDSGIGIGPDVPFFATPVLGQGLTLGDVGVKGFDKKAVDTGNLRVYANFYFQLPTSQYSSQVRHINYSVKTTPYWWYHIQGTRWTVGSWNEAKTYVGAADYTFKLYSEPYVNYRLSPSFALNMSYEMEAHHLVKKPTFDFTNYQTDLQPGFVWNISKTVLVNPYLQLFTGNKVTGDSTAVGAVITARLL